MNGSVSGKERYEGNKAEQQDSLVQRAHHHHHHHQDQEPGPRNQKPGTSPAQRHHQKEEEEEEGRRLGITPAPCLGLEEFFPFFSRAPRAAQWHIARLTGGEEGPDRESQHRTRTVDPKRAQRPSKQKTTQKMHPMAALFFRIVSVLSRLSLLHSASFASFVSPFFGLIFVFAFFLRATTRLSPFIRQNRNRRGKSGGKGEIHGRRSAVKRMKEEGRGGRRRKGPEPINDKEGKHHNQSPW